jgi:hypothetical protein
MRRHYSSYFKGIPNIKETRLKLVTEDSLEVLKATLADIERREEFAF